MNRVELVGRLTNDPEMRENDSLTVARFTTALNRRFKNKDGEYDADFPRCVAFGKTAEFIEKYFKKGMMIGIVGRIQTGSYTNKEGNKVYATEVVVEEVEFVESKKSSEESTLKKPSSKKNDFMNIPDDVDDDLPFN